VKQTKADLESKLEFAQREIVRQARMIGDIESQLSAARKNIRRLRDADLESNAVAQFVKELLLEALTDGR